LIQSARWESIIFFCLLEAALSITPSCDKNRRNQHTQHRGYGRCKISTNGEIIVRHKISIFNRTQFTRPTACRQKNKLLRFSIEINDKTPPDFELQAGLFKKMKHGN